MIDWSLNTDTQFCSVGTDHICFWNLDNMSEGVIKRKAGVFDGEKCHQICVTHDNNSMTYTGGQNGKVYQWSNGSIK
jgi:hypothetical protein